MLEVVCDSRLVGGGGGDICARDNLRKGRDFFIVCYIGVFFYIVCSSIYSEGRIFLLINASGSILSL